MLLEPASSIRWPPNLFYPRRYVLSTTIRADIRPLPTAPVPRLFVELRWHVRVKHFSLRTEKIYIGWMRRSILASAKRHSREMGAAEVGGRPNISPVIIFRADLIIERRFRDAFAPACAASAMVNLDPSE